MQYNQYVAGPDLKSQLYNTEDPVPVPAALSIARGITEGLGAVHNLGLIHRCLNMSSILMVQEGDRWAPRINDFGSIDPLELESRFNAPDRPMQVTPYCAPEQLSDINPAQLDARADFYALGAILFELLTRQEVFHGLNGPNLMLAHMQTEPQAPSALRPELADWRGLDALVLRLLAKDRNDRPRDAAEVLKLLTAIEHILAKRGDPALESPPPAP
jgi:serine/threonine protein kinase